jgi:hypothetical protein
MTHNTLETAKLEEQELLAKLQQLPEYRRLLQLRQVIGILSSSVTTANGTQGVHSANHKQSTSRHAKDHGGTKASIFESAAAGYLRAVKRRATSGELLKVLTERGIAVGGKSPPALLASYLSDSPLFDNVKGKGYGLVEWSRAVSENGASEDELKALGIIPQQAHVVHG